MKDRYTVKCLASLLLLLAFSLASIAPGGQTRSAMAASPEPTGLSNVQLWVYPEYDDPRLLVMLEGQIAGTKAPATVRFLVPSGAQMFSAGWKDAQGKYAGGPPNRQPSNVPGWDEISYEARSSTFRVEYYDSSIIGQDDKKIAYEFRSLYPISDLRIWVQEPLTSSAFSVSPAAQSRSTEEGMVLHQYSYRSLDITKPLSFAIGYTKSDPSPSIQNPSLNSPTSSEPSSSSNPMAIVGIVFAALAAVLVGYALLSKSRSRPMTRQQLRYAAARASNASNRRQPTPVHTNLPPSNQGRGNSRANQPAPPPAPARFCSQCGTERDGPGNFCTKCGARIK